MIRDSLLATMFLIVSSIVYTILYCFYSVFLDWFIDLQEIKQIIVFCMAGSVLWLASHGVNIYLLELGGYWKVSAMIKPFFLLMPLSAASTLLVYHLIDKPFKLDGNSFFTMILCAVFFIEMTIYPSIKLYQCSVVSYKTLKK